MKFMEIVKRILEFIKEGYTFESKHFEVIFSPFQFKENFYNIYIKIWKFSIGITFNKAK